MQSVRRTDGTGGERDSAAHDACSTSSVSFRVLAELEVVEVWIWGNIRLIAKTCFPSPDVKCLELVVVCFLFTLHQGEEGESN